MSKRVFDEAFPDLPHEQFEMSWRDEGCPGDWHIKCGDFKYCVHRIVVTRGTRASHMLRASCDVPVNNAERTTDVTDLLPPNTWGLLESVLDYMYGVNLSETISSVNLARVWKIADVFQIKELFMLCQTRLNDVLGIEPSDLPALLGELWLSMSGRIVDALLAQAAKHFFLFAVAGRFSALTSLPRPAIVAMLKHHDLQVFHEDDVYRLVAEIDGVSGGLEANQRDRQQLWACVRFECLSDECKAAAQDLIKKDDQFPCQQALVEMLGRRTAIASRILCAHENEQVLAKIESLLRSASVTATIHEMQQRTLDMYSYLVRHGRDFLNQHPANARRFISKCKRLRSLLPRWQTLQLLEEALCSLLPDHCDLVDEG